MDYVFLGKTLPFDRVSGKLLFTDDRLQIVDLERQPFSRHGARRRRYFARAKTIRIITPTSPSKRVDFPRLTDLYYKYKTSRAS